MLTCCCLAFGLLSPALVFQYNFCILPAGRLTLHLLHISVRNDMYASIVGLHVLWAAAAGSCRLRSAWAAGARPPAWASALRRWLHTALRVGTILAAGGVVLPLSVGLFVDLVMMPIRCAA